MIFVLILFHLFVRLSQASQPPVNGDFRYDAVALQIYFENEWYYIENSFSFGYFEANRICGLFLKSTLLSYSVSVVSSPIMRNAIGFACTDETSRTENCDFSGQQLNLTNEVINITCRDLGPEDELIQLEDRSIAIPTTAGNLSLWGHFCYHQNDGWDLKAATLVCNSLGYNGVIPGKEKLLVYKGVLGLENVNCEDAKSFDQCTFSVTTRPRGQCDNNKVITIECANDEPTSSQTSPPDNEPTTSLSNEPPTVTIVTDTVLTETVSVSPSVSYYSSLYTTAPPTNFLNANKDWMLIGAGVVICVLLVNFGIIVLLFLSCLYCLKKKPPQAILNLDHLYGSPNLPGTLRERAEQDPPLQQYYVLP